MTNSKTILDEIKKDLAKARIATKPATAKHLVEELAGDIQKQLNAGASLTSVYEIIRARLPGEIKLTLGSFRKYWTQVRNSSGLLGKRGRADENFSKLHFSSKGFSHVADRVKTPNVVPAKTADKFRKDPDNI
jgi:hypothetical protein